jgi:hypothetical protein
MVAAVDTNGVRTARTTRESNGSGVVFILELELLLMVHCGTPDRNPNPRCLQMKILYSVAAAVEDGYLIMRSSALIPIRVPLLGAVHGSQYYCMLPIAQYM